MLLSLVPLGQRQYSIPPRMKFRRPACTSRLRVLGLKCGLSGTSAWKPHCQLSLKRSRPSRPHCDRLSEIETPTRYHRRKSQRWPNSGSRVWASGSHRMCIFDRGVALIKKAARRGWNRRNNRFYPSCLSRFKSFVYSMQVCVFRNRHVQKNNNLETGRHLDELRVWAVAGSNAWTCNCWRKDEPLLKPSCCLRRSYSSFKLGRIRNDAHFSLQNCLLLRDNIKACFENMSWKASK